MDQEKLKHRIEKFFPQMSAITRARSHYEIQHFVVGRHENKWRQWYQIVIETEEKVRALENARLDQRMLLLEIEELGMGRLPDARFVDSEEDHLRIRLDQIHNEKIEIEIERKRQSLLRVGSLITGALKEIDDFIRLAETQYSEFWGKSEEELALQEKAHWRMRLARQIQVEILTFGRPQAGNIACLLQLPKEEQEAILKESLSRTDEYQSLADSVNKNYQLEAVKDRKQLKE